MRNLIQLKSKKYLSMTVNKLLCDRNQNVINNNENSRGVICLQLNIIFMGPDVRIKKNCSKNPTRLNESLDILVIKNCYFY